MKKKIGIFLSAEPSYGGTFQYCQSMLEAVAALPSNDFEVLAAYTNPIWKDILKKYPIKTVQISDNISYKNIQFKTVFRNIEIGLSLKWQLKFLDPVSKVLVKQKCDLWIFPAQEDYSRLVNLTSLGIIHDLMHRYESKFPEVSENGIYDWRENQYRNLCKWAKGILVDSEVGRQHVHESYGMDNDKIFTLPYIPPRYIYEYKSEYISDFDQRCDLPKKFIFYPAQFWKHKNHVSLIKAVANLREEIKDIKLVLSGYKNNAYEESYQLVKELGLEEEVSFIGYVPDQYMPEFYRRARAMIMPTFFGPTNIPPLEAFVLGCPVAVSSIYGMPKQVGDAALLFNPNSVDEIANCIKRLWTDDNLCKELVEKGYKRTEEWGQKQFRNRLNEIIKIILKDDKRSKIQHCTED